MAYVPAVDELFPLQVATIEDLATRAAEKVAAERAKLVRSDGSPMYMPEEHAERERAILADAGAAYDAETARHLAMADDAREKAEAELVKLDGDPFDRLTADEQARASARRTFVKEDVETLPADELVRLARAALVAKDRAGCYLFLRYLARRPRATGDAAGLATVVRDLGEVFGAGERGEKRRGLERKIEASKSLKGRVDLARRRVDGRHERMEAGLRRQFANFF